jgi:hypothetical protein
MARRFIDVSIVTRYMTGVGEFILALLLLARRCNVSVENTTSTPKGGDAS